MDKATHFFYAVKLPSEIKQKLHNEILNLKEDLPFHKWVHQEDYHITLAFLGHAEKDMLDKSKQYITEGLAGLEPFVLSFSGIDTFGRKDAPRIFWLRLEQQSKLNELRQRVFDGCEQAGFSLEKRPFQPHVTIARKWRGDMFNQQLLQEKNPFINTPPLRFTANEVVLYQTHLDREPKYEVIHSFKL